MPPLYSVPAAGWVIVAGRRLVRGHRQHRLVAQDVAEIVGDHDAEHARRCRLGLTEAIV